MKVFFAGVLDDEGTTMPLLMDGLLRNLFPSYFSVHMSDTCGTRVIASIPAVRKAKGITVWDSGAHSFFSSSGGAIGSAGGVSRTKSGAAPNPAAYFQRYYQWVRANHEALADFFVELDIGEVIGQQTVLKWRKLWERAGLLHKAILCYHPALMSYADYCAMLKDLPSRYVALEGPRSGQCHVNYRKFVDAAYAEGIRVHGFALTNVKYMYTAPFYSVDSSSWKAVIRWGVGPKPANLQEGSTGMLAYRKAGTNSMRVLPVPSLQQASGYLQDLTAFRGTSKLPSRVNAERSREGVEGMLQLERRVSAYWRRRGYDWDAQLSSKGTIV